MTVVAVDPAKGAFELEIGAFEDAGARWELPLDDVTRFQFADAGATIAGDALIALEAAMARFDRELAIDCDPGVRDRTLRRVAEARGSLALELRLAGSERIDLVLQISRREGDTRLYGALEEAMERGLAELELELARTFVSNPGSGEHVKGHAIVLAELGLCPFRGRVVRDPELFDGDWCKERRAEHIVTRLAFTQAMYAGWGLDTVTAFRGAAVDGPIAEPAPASLVSATLSREVAAEHFKGGPSTRTAVMWRQEVPLRRLFMSFMETRAMNDRYREGEIVLLAEPGNRAF